MAESREERIRSIAESLKELTDGQIGCIEAVIQQFNRPATFWRLDTSNLISDCILQDFGDALRIHHCFSKEPFTKDKFEYAFERICNVCGADAKLAGKGNPGHDITIRDESFSLKTQADRNTGQCEVFERMPI